MFTPDAPLTYLDRMVAYVAPTWALRRARDRRSLYLLKLTWTGNCTRRHILPNGCLPTAAGADVMRARRARWTCTRGIRESTPRRTPRPRARDARWRAG